MVYSKTKQRQRQGNLSKEQKDENYNRFFIKAFTNIDVSEIKKEGVSTLRDFSQVSKGYMKKDYYDVLASSFGLKKAIFEKYFKDEQIQVVKYKRKEKSIFRFQVKKGMVINFSGKVRKGGQFLPKSYFDEN